MTDYSNTPFNVANPPDHAPSQDRLSPDLTETEDEVASIMMVIIERPVPIIVLVACVGFFVYRFVIYPMFLSPLAKIPNAHWSAPLTPLWILYIRYSRQENATLHASHQKFGSIVRVGPHELSIDKFDNVRAVYQGGFEKSNFYSIFDNYGYVYTNHFSACSKFSSFMIDNTTPVCRVCSRPWLPRNTP